MEDTRGNYKQSVQDRAKPLYARRGYLPTPANFLFGLCTLQGLDAKQTKNIPVIENFLYILTLIALRACKAFFTQAAERAPLPVTAAPLATRGKLLHVGAVVVNKTAAQQSVGRFSRGTKVIQLDG